MLQSIRISNWSREDFAREVALPLATISRYLGGKRQPQLPQLLKIASHFGVSLDWLIGGDADKYDTYAPKIREVAELYSLATDDDRLVIDTILKKYKME